MLQSNHFHNFLVFLYALFPQVIERLFTYDFMMLFSARVFKKVRETYACQLEKLLTSYVVLQHLHFPIYYSFH